MNLPRHVPIDDDTIIVINGISTIPWSGFLRINSFEPEEVGEIRAALRDVGEFHGGGGAAAEFHLTLLTHRVTEFKLREVEKLPIKRSVFFSGLSPDDLAGETSRLAGKLGRVFALTPLGIRNMDQEDGMNRKVLQVFQQACLFPDAAVRF